ncbi:helix-turn-helix domain-containing protein [Shimia sp.]|jgi:AraC-like DNA-binding protein|uniref:helix-turn-helix domain-containing protein n=1 Tax=unclassified Shimia TaxID=2630038 RepID=UPI0025D125D6|nr:AraC family transcriptional regulator [Shimia sp.]MCH2069345.1 AraC family transcriptional regulator [Shimia sp.]
MSVDLFPGEFRVGVLNETISGVSDDASAPVQPKFLVLILLKGRQKFYVDGQLVELNAGEGDAAEPVGYAVLFTKECDLQFAGSWGDPFQKISIAGPPDWFDHIARDMTREEGLPNFPKQHLEQRIWSPSKETLRLAQQIIFSPPEDSDQQLGLFRMSRALEVLRRIPAEITATEDHTAKTSLQNNELKPLERIRLHILENLTQDISLEYLEQTFGLNRRSIQRRFKQAYGVSVSQFVRKSRLKRANEALQKEGLPLAKAAHLAGYSSPANFATAFRREFGVAPTTVRNREI